MGNRTIFLDGDSELSLENIRKENPEFNLSAFIQTKLTETGNKDQNIDQLKITLADKTANILKLKSEVEIMENQLAKIEAEEMTKEQEQEQEKLRQERKKVEGIKVYAGNLFSFFDITREMAILVAEEMWERPKEQRKSIFEEGRERGFKEK